MIKVDRLEIERKTEVDDESHRFFGNGSPSDTGPLIGSKGVRIHGPARFVVAVPSDVSIFLFTGSGIEFHSKHGKFATTSGLIVIDIPGYTSKRRDRLLVCTTEICVPICQVGVILLVVACGSVVPLIVVVKGCGLE